MRRDEPRITIYTAGPAFDPVGLFKDIADGLSRRQVWLAFAWDETKQRYRRSVLGLAWILISYLVFVLAITLFFGGFATASERDFVVHVALNFAAFTFLSGNITDGCDVFEVSAPWIKSTPLPYSIYIFRSVARSLFPFAIQLTGAVALMIVLGWRPAPKALMAIPVLGLFLLNAVAIQIIFGFLAARFRDIAHLTGVLNRILFFTTPVLWLYAETTGLVRQIADLNPFTHLIEAFRAPMMLADPHPNAYLYALLTTAIAWALAILVGGLMRRRLPFWV